MTLTRQQLACIFIGLLILVVIPILKRKSFSKSGSSMSLYDSIMLSFFGRTPKKASATTEKKASAKTQRNGNKSDLYMLANNILSVAKHKNFFVIMPVKLASNDIELSLSGLVVTKSTIIGFHCFGFGGTITKNEAVWSQYINGQSRQLDSISKICADDLDSLNAFLKSIGIEAIPTSIAAVFTTPNVIIPKDKLCYTKDSFIDYISSYSNTSGDDINPKELGKKLATYKLHS